MAEKAKAPPPTFPTFLEVNCKSSGKTRRFALGTEAGFAVSLINRKLSDQVDSPLVFYIEAVKEGEEPIAFGPNSVLCDYGVGWKLQTVTQADFNPDCGKNDRNSDDVRWTTMRVPAVTSSSDQRRERRKPKPAVTFLYIGKILLAFCFMFLLGGIFTYFLEILPTVIMYANSM